VLGLIPPEAITNESVASSVSVLHHTLRNDLTLAYGALDLMAESPDLPADLQPLAAQALRALEVAQQRLSQYG
jgi:hypothetical protein